MSTSSVTPITINGISQYASDFQSILNRAVQIGSIPLQQLQITQSQVQAQIQAASTLSSSVASVASALTALGNDGSNQALVANSSDTSVVTAQATGATANTSYTISNVTSIASAASESSLSSYGDATSTPVSTTGSMQLTVGSNQYQISLTNATNNLQGLESAINGLNAGVTAQILTTANGDYLSLSANSPGATTLQLADDPTGANTQWLTNQNQGSNTVFNLNGVSINTPNTTINNVVPGLTFTITGKTSPNQVVNISLSSNLNQVSTDLQALVTNYNSMQQQVNAQSGSSAGALSGDSVIFELRNAMLQLAGYYNPSGSVHSLADLGVTFNQDGSASFDASTLNSLSSAQIPDVFSVLGSATAGLGGLASAFSDLSDPTSGAIASEINGWNTESQKLTTQMNDTTTQINTMQTLLSQQLEAADAQVAELTSQQNVLTSSINALNYSTYGQQILSSQGL
ncbi:MAG TPA: flagellar filament capping protein FliD [Bryobacteraceae bacterium]|jgi:flagellar hook-associated protein 2|nr:flagellar filament capping protein FliD [Bryobacteraceae bacterium]